MISILSLSMEDVPSAQSIFSLLLVSYHNLLVADFCNCTSLKPLAFLTHIYLLFQLCRVCP